MLLIAAAVGAVLLMGLPTVPAVFPMVAARAGRRQAESDGRRQVQPDRLAHDGHWLGRDLDRLALARHEPVGHAARDGRGRPAARLYELSLHTTAVALGVVAGFVSQIPGGLVVREWVSGELLEPVYGPSVALVSTIIFRLVLLVSELVISIILYAAGWRRTAQVRCGRRSRVQHFRTALMTFGPC